jgi:tetrahydromethanopterin S-methyltransferase subunit D
MLLGGLVGGIGGNVLYNNVVKPAAQRAALPYLMAK